MKIKKSGKESEKCVFEGKKCRNAGKLSICNKCLHFMIMKRKDFVNYDCKFEA